MRKILAKIWEFGCVPFVLLCGRVIFDAVSLICAHGGTYFGQPARFIIALLLCVTGMFLLRRMPKRALIVSSAAVCVISLVYYLLMAYRLLFGAAENPGLLTVQNILGVFTPLPNNIIFPIAALFGAGSSFASAIVFTAIEIIFPMVYAFSGVFNRLTALWGKKREKDVPAE